MARRPGVAPPVPEQDAGCAGRAARERVQPGRGLREALGAESDPVERHSARLATVAFVRNGEDVLLMRHPAGGDRFAGLWNGIGGHVEAGEGIRAAARRELREESGLDVSDLRLAGVIHEAGLVGRDYVIFLFVGESRQRLVRCEAGRELRWQPLERIAELPLVPDVSELLPRLLASREVIFATETYDGADRRLSLRFDALLPAGTPRV